MATRVKTWGDFKRWCRARNLAALPAHAWTIAAYLRWMDRRHGAKAARAALQVIAREHLLKSARVPDRHPTVQRTLALIERRAETQAQRSDLFDENILAEASFPSPKTAEEAPQTRRRRALAGVPRLKRRRPV